MVHWQGRTGHLRDGEHGLLAALPRHPTAPPHALVQLQGAALPRGADVGRHLQRLAHVVREYPQKGLWTGDLHRRWGRGGELERTSWDGGFDAQEEVRSLSVSILRRGRF